MEARRVVSLTWVLASGPLREPFEALVTELLVHPQLCSHQLHGKLLVRRLRATWTGEMFGDRLGLPRIFAVSQRLMRLRCCSNPLSRGLISSLPTTAISRRCIVGRCDASTLYSLGRRARCACRGLALDARSGRHSAFCNIRLASNCESCPTRRLMRWSSPIGRAHTALIGDITGHDDPTTGFVGGTRRGNTALSVAGQLPMTQSNHQDKTGAVGPRLQSCFHPKYAGGLRTQPI